jgi:hypothetical protein
LSRSYLRLLLAVFTVGLIFSTVPLAHAVLSFGPAIRITTNTDDSLHPSAAAVGSYLYVAWEDTTPVTGSGTEPEIWMRVSSNSGASFGPAIRITTNTGHSGWPSVAAVGSYVYVAWHDNTPVTGSGGSYEIWMRASSNNGASFGSPTRITTNSGDSRYPSVAAVGSHVYVAWQDNTPVTGSGGSYEIWMRASSNNGASFGSPIRITTNTGYSLQPSVAADGSYVYVAWGDNTSVSGSGGSHEIWLRVSSNNGVSFGSAIRMSTNTYDSVLASVAASGSYVYLAWADYTPVTGSGVQPEVWMRVSFNYGASFGAAIRLTTNTGISYEPSVAASGTNVLVAWHDSTPVTGSATGDEVWMRASSDYGASFGSPIRITTNTGQSRYPSVAVGSGSAIGGTMNTGNSYDPSGGAVVAKIYVAWQDDTPVSGSGSMSEIWLRASS